MSTISNVKSVVDHDDLSAIMSHTTAAKVITMFVLGLGSFLVGFAPVKLTEWWRHKNPATATVMRRQHPSNNQHHHRHGHVGETAATDSPVMSVLLCFGGGVMLFTTLMHLQPEVRENVHELQVKGHLPNGTGTEHLGDMIFCAGFFMMFAIEDIVNYFLNRSTANVGATAPAAGDSAGDSQRHSVALGDQNASDSRDIEKWATPLDLCDGSGDTNLHSYGGLLAVLALSFHEFFEGMAIGLVESADDVWYLCLAVASHKLVIAFCIGLELVMSKTRTFVLALYVGIFSLVTPVGTVVGMMIRYNTVAGSTINESSPASVVLQGLAAGMLLYIVCFEVLVKYKKSGFTHLLSTLIGFSVLLVVQVFFFNHHHSHHHDVDDDYFIHEHLEE